MLAILIGHSIRYIFFVVFVHSLFPFLRICLLCFQRNSRFFKRLCLTAKWLTTSTIINIALWCSMSSRFQAKGKPTRRFDITDRDLTDLTSKMENALPKRLEVIRDEVVLPFRKRWVLWKLWWFCSGTKCWQIRLKSRERSFHRLGQRVLPFRENCVHFATHFLLPAWPCCGRNVSSVSLSVVPPSEQIFNFYSAAMFIRARSDITTTTVSSSHRRTSPSKLLAWMEFSSGSGPICKPLTSCFASKSAPTSTATSPRTLCCICKATVPCSSNSKKQNSPTTSESASGVFSKSETRRRWVASNLILKSGPANSHLRLLSSLLLTQRWASGSTTRLARTKLIPTTSSLPCWRSSPRLKTLPKKSSLSSLRSCAMVQAPTAAFRVSNPTAVTWAFLHAAATIGHLQARIVRRMNSVLSVVPQALSTQERLPGTPWRPLCLRSRAAKSPRNSCLARWLATSGRTIKSRRLNLRSARRSLKTSLNTQLSVPRSTWVPLPNNFGTSRAVSGLSDESGT